VFEILFASSRVISLKEEPVRGIAIAGGMIFYKETAKFGSGMLLLTVVAIYEIGIVVLKESMSFVISSGEPGDHHRW
jgi:hypothetical protein